MLVKMGQVQLVETVLEQLVIGTLEDKILNLLLFEIKKIWLNWYDYDNFYEYTR